jgi:DNA-binding response OmpR family regulator
MATRILVVDDEPRYLHLLEANLLTEGYEVFTAVDGEQAIEAFSSNQADLILLDVMLPRMDGFTVCQRIRQFSTVPVIMLTAKGEEHDRVRGLDVGADDYLVKPFSVMELLARVRAVLRRAQVSETGADRFFIHGNLRIDFTSVHSQYWQGSNC